MVSWERDRRPWGQEGGPSSAEVLVRIRGPKCVAYPEIVGCVPGGGVDGDSAMPDGRIGERGCACEVGFEERGFGGPGFASVAECGEVLDREEGVGGCRERRESTAAPNVLVCDVAEAGGEGVVVAGSGADGSAGCVSGNLDLHRSLVEDARDEWGEEEIDE